MLQLRTAACVLALFAACADAEEPEPPPPERDASTPVDAGTPLDAALTLLDANLNAPQDARADATADGSIAVSRAWLDVLFVVDDSGSMATEQAKLAREIPRMVGALVTGDPYYGRERPANAPLRPFAPVESLHLGVVSTNVGGIDDFPSNSQEALLSCRDGGDEGLLQASTKVAAEGVVAMNRNEFEGYAASDVVIPPDARCALPAQPKYQEFTLGKGDSDAFVCMSRLGVRGCPFEQPLESAWKALAPSADDSFLNAKRGEGDRGNEGFLRPGAALVVIVLTDEDDCSVTNAGKAMFDLSIEAEERWGNLNLRCGVHSQEPELLRPVDRYLRGLRSLKPGHPERIVFAAISGIPERAVGLGHDAILALPEMQFAEDPSARGFPRTVCENTSGERLEKAYPAVRIVQTAKLFEAQSVLASICSDSYGPAFDRLIQNIVPLLTI